MPFFRNNPELLPAFRAGRRDVLERLYWATVHRVEAIVRHGFWVASSRTHVRGVAAAEVGDVVQEVFARAFRERARNGYDGLREYTPYLSTIARNTVIDWARRRGADVEKLAEDIADLADIGPRADATADEAPLPWADDAVMQVVEAYIAGLPADLRQVHEQRYVLGRSQNDAAAALGTTRQRLRTAEAKLRSGLARELRRAKLKA
jgi:RNA polymerase sigma factor (sigma-70 family)